MRAIISVAAGLFLMNLSMCRPPSNAAEAAGEPTSMMSSAKEELSFEQVLQIAQNGEANAKARLEQIRDKGPADAQLSMLARRILQRWNDGKGTYYSDVPQVLESTCIDTNQLKAMYPSLVEPTRLYVEIRVDTSGRPLRASVIGGTVDQQLKDAVVQSLMQKRYAPAKPDEMYVDATLTVECRVEVR